MLIVNNIYFNRDMSIILKDINLSLSPKKIIHLTGNNGAGKTTLLKILTNIIKPDNGDIFWNGKNIKKSHFDYFKNLTFIMDKNTSNSELTIKENILFWRKIFSSFVSDKVINSMLELLALSKYQNTLANNLSNGELKKLELSRLIIEQKKLWILDEPYLGLDKNSIELINQTFISHCNSGGMIIFSSHINPDISNLEIINLEKHENI
mgnify:CR=1 FL=1|tara:strand:- start:1928 stop:2551 length:624 start_codon:yes stop_codon:yes gene_type:complete